MSYSKTCPACGGTAYQDVVDVGVGLIPMGEFECGCGWIENGPDDYGFVTMEERPFCPEQLADAAGPFELVGMRLALALDLDYAALVKPWRP